MHRYQCRLYQPTVTMSVCKYFLPEDHPGEESSAYTGFGCHHTRGFLSQFRSCPADCPVLISQRLFYVLNSFNLARSRLSLSLLSCQQYILSKNPDHNSVVSPHQRLESEHNFLLSLSTVQQVTLLNNNLHYQNYSS